MIPALIGFGLGWLARGLWEKRRAQERVEAPAPWAEPEIPPAAAFAQGPVASDGDAD
jgi:hypothetical protein